MIPIDLQARESGTLVPRIDPTERRRVIIAEWQTRWSASHKGRWTNSLIPNVGIWYSRRYGDLNFYLTQMLSGYGCFRSYLHRFGHDSDPSCPSCSPSAEENDEHVFFVCHRFAHSWLASETTIGCIIYPTNIIGIMLSSQEHWDLVCSFVKSVLVELRRLERVRRDAEIFLGSIPLPPRDV